MTIIVGYIPTPEGEAALAAAAEEARRRDEPLHVVNVRQSDSSKDPRFLEEPEAERLSDRLAGTGVAFDVQQLVRGKEPAEEIVDAAERLQASLVVIGIRRRRPTGKLLFGSQAQRILLESECPVLAVKSST